MLNQPICCSLTNYHNWGVFTEHTLTMWRVTQVRCLGVAPLDAMGLRSVSGARGMGMASAEHWEG